MKRLFLALLCACGAATQTQATQELQDAADAWGVIEMCPVELHTVDQAALEDECNANRSIDVPADAVMWGCAKLYRCEIWLSSDVPEEKRAAVILHEMGHLLRGEPGHLKCIDQPGDDVMCALNFGITEPTERDREFVGAP